MKRDQLLQVLYDLALVTGSETSVQPLVSRTLQRLLYHTSCACGVFLSDIDRSPAGKSIAHARATLHSVIGGGTLRDRIGKRIELPAALLDSRAGEINDTALIEELFGSKNRYRHGLRLPAGDNDMIMLFAPRPPIADVRLDLVFAPVIRNFARTLNMCRENERIMSELRNELDTRKRLEDQLVKKEKLAVIGQLTSSVNHELRNPLGAIKTSVFLIRRKLHNGDEDWPRHLDVIERNTERCNNIIDQLLGYTRHTELKPRTIILEELLDELIEEYKPVSPVSIVWRHTARQRHTITVDTGLLNRALVNLFDNASQAMTTAEHIASGRGTTITLSIHESDGRLEIHCRDTGPGISAEDLERIFEPLFSTKNFGVGLGMPIVRNILLQLGGDVDVSSREGEGTTARLWLPYHPKEQERAKGSRRKTS